MYGRETVWFIRCYTYKYICAYIYIYTYDAISEEKKTYVKQKPLKMCFFTRKLVSGEGSRPWGVPILSMAEAGGVALFECC